MFSVYVCMYVTTMLLLCINRKVRGREGPKGCEASKFPHCLDDRLIDDGEVVSLTHLPPPPPFTP
jgi:hypothetical protein